MKKNSGFTIAEVILALIIVGILAVMFVASFNKQQYHSKKYVIAISKTLEIIENACVKLLQEKQDNFPMGVFMYNDKIAICPNDGDKPNCKNKVESRDIRDLFSQYIKFSKSGDFKDLVGWNSIGDESINEDIKGAVVPGGTCLGFEVFNTIKDCEEEVYIPDIEKKSDGTYKGSKQITISGKCWGKIYIDINGKEGPNELGKDVYVYGLDESGIAKNPATK